jgi:hypothetical protein
MKVYRGDEGAEVTVSGVSHGSIGLNISYAPQKGDPHAMHIDVHVMLTEEQANALANQLLDAAVDMSSGPVVFLGAARSGG